MLDLPECGASVNIKFVRVNLSVPPDSRKNIRFIFQVKNSVWDSVWEKLQFLTQDENKEGLYICF